MPVISHKIGFESSEGEADDYEFLLFSPSVQHTAAICLQRRPAEASLSLSSKYGRGCNSELSSSSDADSMHSDAASLSTASSTSTIFSLQRASPESAQHRAELHIHDTLQQHWSLHCWKTIPYVKDERMNVNALQIQGCTLYIQ